MALIVADLRIEITPSNPEEMTDWLSALVAIGDPFCVDQGQIFMFPETYMLFEHEMPDRETVEKYQVWAWMNGPGYPHWEMRGAGVVG